MTAQRILAMTLLAAAAVGMVLSCSKKTDIKEFTRDWDSTAAINFTVYTPPDTPRPPRGIDAFATACDETYDYISKQLQLEVEADMSVYLFTTTEQCLAATGRPASYVEGLAIYTRLGAPIGGVIAEAMCNSMDTEAKAFPLIRDGIRNIFDERDHNIYWEARKYRFTPEWPTLEALVSGQAVKDPAVYKYASATFVAFLIQRYGVDQYKMLWRSVLELQPSLEKIYGSTLPQMEAEWIRILDLMAKKT